MKFNVFTFVSFAGVIITSPLFCGVIVGAVGFTRKVMSLSIDSGT